MKKSIRKICFIVAVLIYSLCNKVYATNECKIHYISTGNSNAFLIESNGHYGLIDSSNAYNDGTAQAVTEKKNSVYHVIEYLNDIGVDKLDFIIASHSHSDHIGGMVDIANNFVDENTVYYYREYIETEEDATYNGYQSGSYIKSDDWDNEGYYLRAVSAMKANGANLFEVTSKLPEFNFGSMNIKILNTDPVSDDEKNEKGLAKGENKNSLVVLVTYNNNKILFAGDMETEDEKRIKSTIGDIDVLQMGHHGNISSTCLEFLEIIKPEYVVIPRGEITEKIAINPIRYVQKHFNSKVYLTGCFDNAVILELSENGLIFEDYDKQVSIDSANLDIYTSGDGWKYIRVYLFKDDDAYRWYYFSGDEMYTEWHDIWYKGSKKKFYFNNYGVMKVGWLKNEKGKWYYFNKDGTMQTGWRKINNKWYYFAKSNNEISGFKEGQMCEEYESLSNGQEKAIDYPQVYIAKNGGDYILDVNQTSVSIKDTIYAIDRGDSGFKTLKYQFSKSEVCPSIDDDNWKTFTNNTEFSEKLEGGKYYLYTYVENNNGNRSTDMQKSEVFNIKMQVVYDANGGTEVMDTDIVSYGNTYITKENSFKRKGYEFKGWNEKGDGTGVDWTNWINKEWIWTYIKSITLYAQWVPKSFIIRYNANGGTGDMMEQKVKTGEKYIISENKFENSGYSFVGWTTNSDGTNDNYGWQDGIEWTWHYDNGDFGIENDELVLYARWKKVEISPTSITLDKENVTLDLSGTKEIALKTTITPTNANVNNTVTWTSSDESIAIVESDGKVKAIKNGTCKITATVNGKTAECGITVQTSPTSITLSETTLLFNDLESKDLGITYLPTTSNTAKELIWSSSDEEIVKVENGSVIPQKEGQADIIVKLKDNDSIFAKCHVIIELKIKYLKGDYNKDTKVDITDAYLLLTSIAKNQLLDDEIFSLMDLNNDKKVDVTDAYLLLTSIAKS